jgi:oxygen-independent coproporphyrinogen-3 oxidase
VSRSLFEKYSTPAPRYTSYPTVPFWNQTPTEKEWLDQIRLALDHYQTSQAGVSLYIHIPFCESLCTYCGCNTRIVRNQKVSDPYIETVLKEWELYLSRLDREIAVSEIHLGGGTPTFLTPSQLETLIQGVLAKAKLTSTYDFSVEADPRVTTRAHLETLQSLGFRRLSLGVQDFDPTVQKIVQRVQSVEQVENLTKEARQFGFTSINYDLIYGLPLQTSKSIQTTLEEVKRLQPDRIAFYGYAHVPWIKPSQRKFTENDIPVGEDKRALYELGRALLEEAGYREIGMDHFALPTDSLWHALKDGSLHRNFMGYSTQKGSPLIGLGVSAIGDSWSAFAQNEKLLETYQARIEKGEIPILRGHILNEEDLVLRKHILSLMTTFSTSWKESSLRVPYLEEVKKLLVPFAQDGLVETDESSCYVTSQGRPFLRHICKAFDARNHRSERA